MNQHGTEKKRGVRIVVWFLIVAAAVCIFAFVVYRVHLAKEEALLSQVQETAVEGTIEEIPDETILTDEFEVAIEDDLDDHDIDFDELREINPDIYAWIYMPGTVIDYPILQSGTDKEEDYYLDHNLDGSSGYPGCIYTQKRNNQDFSDPNTVIYGHDMQDGTMFKALHEFMDEDFFKENQYFYIYTSEEGKLTYHIFAAYLADNSLILEKYNDFQDQDVFATYLSDILNQNNSDCHLNKEVTVTAEDKIVTLSTCIGDDNYRYLVQGVLEE